ncbi:hypothetical protein [Marinobacterium marinum]|uniref:Uncharacterized protein n=1 Tax=Marinobacterium marinum TaxID=2756129 RepID=A0A7W2ABB8_9GAMM|nr:hypothetical protein [Marinobacterium marinum]MBA4500893.1 hypothetical protein [Marinobacterium marinum]
MSDAKSGIGGGGDKIRSMLSLRKKEDIAVEKPVAKIEKDRALVEEKNELETENKKKSENRSVKGCEPKKTAQDILLGAFSKQHDKDGSIKPAKITKRDLKSLNSLNTHEVLTRELVNSIAEAAALTDPSLDCLAELALSVTDESEGDWQQALFTFCVQVASGVWIHKHTGSVDLFRDIFVEHNNRDDWPNILEYSLSQKYQKRIAGLKSRETFQSSGESEALEPVSGLSSREQQKTLEKQHRNLLLIGVLWLLNESKCDLRDIIGYLNESVVIDHGSKATLKDVSLLLAGQWLSPSSRVIRLLAMQAEQRTQLEDDLKRTEKLMLQKDQQIEQLRCDLTAKKNEVQRAITEAQNYQTALEELKKQAEDQQLDARAARTHLRDNEGKVRAKAFNLLSEEVLEPLRLSLSALQRENPKTKVAIHQIELVVESIERDLQWFKE